MDRVTLTAEEKKARNKYLREWYNRPENKEKRKQYAKNYWSKIAQEVKQNN